MRRITMSLSGALAGALARDPSGSVAIEYCLLAALVCLGVMATLTELFTGSVTGLYAETAGKIAAAVSG